MHSTLRISIAVATVLSQSSVFAAPGAKTKATIPASDSKSALTTTTTTTTVENKSQTTAQASYSGSSSMGQSSSVVPESAYLQVSLLPFDKASITVEGKATSGASVSKDFSGSYWRSADPAIDLFARHNKIIVRPRIDLGGSTPAATGTGNAASVSEFATQLRVGYLAVDNVEVGASIGVSRLYVEAPQNADTLKTLNSAYSVGPYGVYYMALDPVKLEAGGFLNYTTKATESTVGSTTTKSSDNYVWALGAHATVVYPLSTGLDYGAGVLLGYTTETLKVTGGETNTKILGLGIYPAVLRFRF